jgi:hypothetical protein
MKQTLHIFAKDSRRLLPEILIALALTLAFVRLYPEQWGAHVARFWFPSWVPNLVTGLLPVSWWLLISRSVHAESLVGERQFWVTRPYRWGSLLAAKLLFLPVYVLVPYFLALCLLLWEAGFQPGEHIGGLLYEVLLAICIVIIPLLVLSCITSSFGKVTLAVLLVLAFAGAVAWLSTRLPESSTSSDWGVTLGIAAIEMGFAGVVVLQYARRRTTLARMLVAGLAVVIAAFGLVGPEELPMRETYPPQASARALPLQLGFDTQQPDSSKNLLADDDSQETDVSFPLTVAGIGPSYAVQLQNVKATITAQSGERWTSHWQGVYANWMPGERDGKVTVKVNRYFLDRVRSGPVRVELRLAVTELQSGAWTRMRLPEGRFTIPGGSLCHRSGQWGNELSCRSALRQPPLMLVATRFATQPCSRDRVLVSDGDTATDWVGTTDTDAAEFGLSSVWTTPVGFTRYSSDASQKAQYLCPGSIVAFAPYSVRDRRQITVTSPLVKLDDYRARSYM